ncbi:glycosyltransferase [Patescibacteria group bacterium]|nr:glycosyltransferase [Patescibacteria group bacterium]
MNRTSIKKKIAIIHPALNVGGTGAVAMWIIKALQDDYEVTLITTESLNFNKMDIFLGINQKSQKFMHKEVLGLPIFRRSFLNGFLLKVHLAERYYKKHQSEFDLAIATCCEIDLGKPGIQYIHFPFRDDEPLRQIGQLSNKGIYGKGLLRKIYKKFCAYISKFSEKRMKENITLVNSNWTREIVQEVYGISSQVIYPPVQDDFPEVPWKNREDGFVCIGLVTPNKEIEKIIDIIKQIRNKFSSIHLHLIGKDNNSEYALKINSLCVQNSNWLFWEKNTNRKDMTNLVSRHKYGIHGMLHEHFGIVVAEMINAGCIPFVPNGGGQVEIVTDRRLIYEDTKDAVYKIINVIKGEAFQEDIREKLLRRRNQFSTEKFVESIRLIVEQALAQKI